MLWNTASPNGDNFLSNSFHLYCAAASRNPSALSEWEFEELWEAGPGLVQPSPCISTFFSEYSQPQPKPAFYNSLHGNLW